MPSATRNTMIDGDDRTRLFPFQERLLRALLTSETKLVMTWRLARPEK